MTRSRFNRVMNDAMTNCWLADEPPIQLKRLAPVFCILFFLFSFSLLFFLPFPFFFASSFLLPPPPPPPPPQRIRGPCNVLKPLFYLILFFSSFPSFQRDARTIARAIVFSISQPQPSAAMTDCTVTMRARRPLFVPRFISNVNIAWNT